MQRPFACRRIGLRGARVLERDIVDHQQVVKLPAMLIPRALGIEVREQPVEHAAAARFIEFEDAVRVVFGDEQYRLTPPRMRQDRGMLGDEDRPVVTTGKHVELVAQPRPLDGGFQVFRQTPPGRDAADERGGSGPLRQGNGMKADAANGMVGVGQVRMERERHRPGGIVVMQHRDVIAVRAVGDRRRRAEPRGDFQLPFGRQTPAAAKKQEPVIVPCGPERGDLFRRSPRLRIEIAHFDTEVAMQWPELHPPSPLALLFAECMKGAS